MAKKKETGRQFLARKKAEGAKLSKLAEWYLSDDPDKLYVEIKDMRAVLR